MTLATLTKTERSALLFIKRYIMIYRVSPSLREFLTEETGILSTSHAAYVRDSLVNQGYIEVIPRIARGIILTHKGEAF